MSISGCTLRCKGCHSPFLWREGTGTLVTKYWFESTLEKYAHMATCVLFMGGEWHQEELVSLLKLAKTKHYKTCLYTGEEYVSDEILNELTWIKTGKWDELVGGLDDTRTNQKFIEVKTNKILNHLFT